MQNWYHFCKAKVSHTLKAIVDDMNYSKLILFLLVLGLSACSAPKSYFTVDVRKRIEAKSITVDQLQFYVDRDVELRRELSSGNTQVTSGKVKFENGKYIHIIVLKAFTPGVCVNATGEQLNVSFEADDAKYLIFGVGNSLNPQDIYQITAKEWTRDAHYGGGNTGQITYDGETYYIQSKGSQAQLMIKKSVVDKLEVERRVMKGRKLN